MNIHSNIRNQTHINMVLNTIANINSYISMNKTIDIIINIIMNNIMNIHSSKIINLIKKEKIVTSSEVASYLGVSWNTAEKYLLELIIDGKIDKIKKVGVNLWILRQF